MSATMSEAQPVGMTEEEKQAQRQAAEREARALNGGDELSFVWLASNRVDDQVVIHERDTMHPGGECFVGGSGVDYCAKTPAIEGLLRQGSLIAIPEPPPSRFKPVVLPTGAFGQGRDVPGTPGRLGRQINPELVGNEADMKKIEKQVESGPKEIPVPPQVEKVPEPREPEAQSRPARR